MSATPNNAHQSNAESAFWCGFYGCGIIGTLLVYGVLQEKIMSVKYGEELFGYSVFLVLCNRLLTFF